MRTPFKCGVAVVVVDIPVPDYVEHSVFGSYNGRDSCGPLSVHLSPVAQRSAHEPVTC